MLIYLACKNKYSSGVKKMNVNNNNEGNKSSCDSGEELGTSREKSVRVCVRWGQEAGEEKSVRV